MAQAHQNHHPRIIVTGASGTIGSHVVPLLEKAGYELILCGRDPDKYSNRTIHRVEDLLNIQLKCDVLLHLAILNNDQSGTNKDFEDANVLFLEDVLTVVRKTGVTTTIYPASTHASPDAKTAYGRSKYKAEQTVRNANDMTVKIMRLPAAYGDLYQGKLSGLNYLPHGFRNVVQKILGSFRPMVRFDRISSALLEMLEQHDIPEEVLITDDQSKNMFYVLGKRTIDLAFGLTVLIFLWWLLLLIWGLIWVSSAGPGILAQERVGQHQKTFTCYKFRTMKLGTVSAGTHEVSQASVTKIGKFLRRCKIDELPQIWNLFKGDMSLTGPRPGLPVQTELIKARAERGVYSVKPGISGLSQVNGVDMSEPMRLAQLDAQYIAKRSHILDFKIILATLYLIRPPS